MLEKKSKLIEFVGFAVYRAYLQEDTSAFARSEGGLYVMKPAASSELKKQSVTDNATAKPEETSEAPVKKQKIAA